MFRESCEKSGEACEFESSGMKAQTLYRKAVWHVAISASEDTQQSFRLVEKAVSQFPKVASHHVSLGQVQMAKGNMVGVRSALNAAEKANKVLADQEVVSRINDVRGKMELVDEFGSLAAVDAILAGANLMQKTDWIGAIGKFDSARRAQPRTNESTLKILLLKRNCYESMRDYSGLAQCTSDIKSTARSLGLVVNL